MVKLKQETFKTVIQKLAYSTITIFAIIYMKWIQAYGLLSWTKPFNFSQFLIP